MKTRRTFSEFDSLVQSIADATCKTINNEAYKIESDVIYNAQCVLELLIKELESRV